MRTRRKEFSNEVYDLVLNYRCGGCVKCEKCDGRNAEYYWNKQEQKHQNVCEKCVKEIGGEALIF